MTPKIIELKQAPVVLVELPSKPSNNEDILLERTGSGIAYALSYPTKPGMCRTISFDMDFPDYVKMIGVLSDLTEEQFAECLSNIMHDPLSVDIIFDKDLFYKIIESEKVYIENPYNRPSYHDADRNYWMLEGKWQEAQSRTIDPKRTVVLLRKDETK